jgi:hypothetical protein
MTEKEHKIRGWLILFLIVLAIGGSITPILIFAEMSISSYDLGLGYAWSVVDSIFAIGAFVISFYTIWAFYTYKPDAVWKRSST